MFSMLFVILSGIYLASYQMYMMELCAENEVD